LDFATENLGESLPLQGERSELRVLEEKFRVALGGTAYSRRGEGCLEPEKLGGKSLLLGATIVLRERLLVLGNLGDFGFTRKAFS
jgi:hypothetical protein